MAVGGRMGSHYLVGFGYEEDLCDGCRGGMRLHYLVGVGYEDLCDGCRGRDEVALPCGGWL